jgi:hypothetical protein
MAKLTKPGRDRIPAAKFAFPKATRGAAGERLSCAQRDSAFSPSPYSFVARVPQDLTEKLLVEQLRRKGGSVEYETKFVSANQRKTVSVSPWTPTTTRPLVFPCITLNSSRNSLPF